MSDTGVKLRLVQSKPNGPRQAAARNWRVFWLVIFGVGAIALAILSVGLLPEPYQKLVAMTALWSAIGFLPTFLFGGSTRLAPSMAFLLGSLGSLLVARSNNDPAAWIVFASMLAAGGILLALRLSKHE